MAPRQHDIRQHWWTAENTMPYTYRVQKRAKRKGFKVYKDTNGLLDLALSPRPERQQIAQRNLEASSLLRLPLEIRKKIYAYVLGGNEYSVYIPNKIPICAIEDGPTDPGLKLLSTCTQVYSEAALLPFTLNTFAVWPHVADRWVDSLLPGQKDAIVTLRFNFPEAQQGTSYLSSFPGLRRIHICWTPDNHSDLTEIAQALREDAKKDILEVVFWG